MKRSITLFFLALCLCPFMIGEGFAESDGKWVLVGFTKYRDGLFCDMNRVSSPSSGQISAWIRIAPSPKSRYRTEIATYLGQCGRDSRSFKFIEIQCNLDCSKNWIKFARFNYHDREGQVFYFAAEQAPPWQSIQSGSLWDRLQKTVCK